MKDSYNIIEKKAEVFYLQTFYPFLISGLRFTAGFHFRWLKVLRFVSSEVSGYSVFGVYHHRCEMRRMGRAPLLYFLLLTSCFLPSFPNTSTGGATTANWPDFL